MENTSNEILRAVTSNVAINGLEFQDGTWSTDAIGPGKRRVSALTLSSTLDEHYQEIFGISESGIAKLEDITEIELAVEVRDNDYNTVADPVIVFAGKPALG